MGAMMKISQLAELPLRDVHKHVNREQLIIMISKQQLSWAISYCNHFELNGLELAEVATIYDNADALKVELLKGLIVHCPNARSAIFVDTALSLCNAILGGENNGQGMIARMYVSIFRTISKYLPDKSVDKELLKNTGHFVLTYQNYRRIIDHVIENNHITLNDLEYVLTNNRHLESWVGCIDQEKLSTLPNFYHDTLIRYQNRLKLLGKI